LRSQDLNGRHWLTFTFEPVTFSKSQCVMYTRD